MKILSNHLKKLVLLLTLSISFSVGCKIDGTYPVKSSFPVPSFSSSISPTPVYSPSFSPIPTSEINPSPSLKPSPTISPSPLASVSVIPSNTPSPSVTATPSNFPTPSLTPKPDNDISPSWSQVYFSHVSDGTVRTFAVEQNIDNKLVEKLNIASKSIDMAAFELDSIKISDALVNAKKRNVKVRIVTDSDYMGNRSVINVIKEGIPVTEDNRSGFMHNKFIIIDGEYLWTGSFNPTDNDSDKNNNNSIIIKSKELSDNYLSEFNEMFEKKQFGSKSDPLIVNPLIKMSDNTELISLFSPENDPDKFIIDEIKKAQKKIYFLAFSFTHDGIGDAMIAKQKEGLDVRGIFENRGAQTTYSEFPKMQKAGLDVRLDINSNSLHHKIIIIDDKTVMMGSFNFSENATSTNDENLLTIRNNNSIAKNYLDEFNTLFSVAKKN